MEAVVLVIHLILAVTLIGLILLQRSEGGGLGIGGSGGLGSLASPHSAASALTRATKWVAGMFFCTSLILAILAGGHHKANSIMDELDAPAAATSAATPVDQTTETPQNTEAQPEAPAPSVPVSE